MVYALRVLVATRDSALADAVREVVWPLGCAVDTADPAQVRTALDGTGYDLLCVEAQPPECEDLRASVAAAARLPAATRPRVIGIAVRAPAARACRQAGAETVAIAALPTAIVTAGRDADREVIDLRMLTSLRELQEPNSPDLPGELLGMFREDGQRRIARLREALEAADRDQLRLTAHSLKGSAGNLGASRLARVCAVIESSAADAALPVLDALVARASRVFHLSVEALGRV